MLISLKNLADKTYPQKNTHLNWQYHLYLYLIDKLLLYTKILGNHQFLSIGNNPSGHPYKHDSGLYKEIAILDKPTLK